MTISLATPLLGGLTPEQFMRRHWQKKPLLVRGAVPDARPPIERAALFDLAAREEVESRLVARGEGRWSLREGPFARRSLPPVSHPGWSLLVQGLDLHVQAAHELLARFRFVPDARLDDLMLSWASDGGGVGPHFDSYDVFLLQVQGRRRWRIGRQRDMSLEPGAPLKILSRFEPEEEWLLEPGDMLYLPPRWAHEGTAEGECMTCSIGFRSSRATELACDLLQALVEHTEAPEGDRLYADPRQPATDAPGRIPATLASFAAKAVEALLHDEDALACSLGEVLSAPKPAVVFEPAAGLVDGAGLRLDRRSRMMYDDRHVFINGESYRAAGRDARLMRRLADTRVLAAAEVARLSADAHALLDDWAFAGWLHVMTAGEADG